MKDRLSIALLLAVVVLVYGNSLLNQFTLDDGYYIIENPHVTNPSIQGMFAPQTYTKVFRPVTFATLALNWKLNPGQPFGFHLFNLILHAAVTLLLYLLLQTIFSGLPGRDPWTQADLSLERNTFVFAAAALFAVHPIHTEAVSSIVGRSELLAAGFLFAAWILHIRDLPLPAAICFLLALLSKESAAVFLPLILIVDYVRNEWKPRVHYFLFAGVTLAYLGLLWKVHGDYLGERIVTTRLDNPLAAIPTGWRILNALRVAWKYAALHIYPATLSCDYSFDQIRVYFDWGHTWAAAFGSMGVAGAWLWAVWKRRIVVALAGSIYLVGFATTANILVPIRTIMGERLAYLPSAGFCLLAALSWSWLKQRQRMAAWVVLTGVVTVLGIRTIARNRNWKDNFTLFSADVRSVPESARIHAELGGVYMEKKELEMAAAEFQKALRIDPDNGDALSNYGLLESWNGNYQHAGKMLERAFYLFAPDSPNYDFVAVNFAALLMQTDHLDGALDLLNREIAQSPKYARAWSNRAVIRYKQGEPAPARGDAEEALRLDPNNAQAQNLLRLLGPTSRSASQH
jgi:Tfp pilus assembly protein PilF